jgi:hypothetical protein
MLSAARVLEATEQEHESNLASLEQQIEMRLEFLRTGPKPKHPQNLSILTRAHTHKYLAAPKPLIMSPCEAASMCSPKLLECVLVPQCVLFCSFKAFTNASERRSERVSARRF